MPFAPDRLPRWLASTGDQCALRAIELLRSLLIGSLLWLLLQATVAIPFFAIKKPVSFLLTLAGLLINTVALIVLRKGHLKLATWLFLGGFWSGSLICACLSGGIRSVYMILHAVIPVIAGPLLGARAAVLSLGLSVFATLLMTISEALGSPLPNYFPMRPAAAWMVVLLALVLGTLPVSHFFRVLSAALKDVEQQARRFSHDAMHDPLTGLPNRTLFLDRLNHCIHTNGREPGKFAVLFIDLDRFKVYNDTLGHNSGDRLLKLVGDRLAGIMRSGDTLARHSGDEFTVLLERLNDAASAEVVAGRIARAFDSPFLIDHHSAFLSASIGIVMGSPGYEKGEDMLHDADSAMYRAKAFGGARHVIFSEQIRRSLIESGQLERDLRLACERDEFVLGYEPMVCLRTGEVHGYEALLRWRHPTRGLLYPRHFLQCAEESDLILKIDRWVISKACQQLAEWRHIGIPLNVNVSGRSLREIGFIESVTSRLEELAIPPGMLKLEITEQVLVEAAQSFTVLEQLRDHGVELVLDDFGTGYCSLSYLTRFPISHLKIDQTFIRGLETGDRSRVVVGAMIAMADGLGIDVTAEGVESRALFDTVRKLGCRYGQGYYVGRGIPSADVEKQMAAAGSTYRHTW